MLRLKISCSSLIAPNSLCMTHPVSMAICTTDQPRQVLCGYGLLWMCDRNPQISQVHNIPESPKRKLSKIRKLSWCVVGVFVTVTRDTPGNGYYVSVSSLCEVIEALIMNFDILKELSCKIWILPLLKFSLFLKPLLVSFSSLQWEKIQCASVYFSWVSTHMASCPGFIGIHGGFCPY